jgi:hypothetical protein
MKNFHVVLRSDMCKDIFPGNNISEFTNQLSKPLILDNSWSVALSEITHPSLSQYISDPIVFTLRAIFANYENPINRIRNKILGDEIVTLRPGFYDAQQLVDALHSGFKHLWESRNVFPKDRFNAPNFCYNESTHRVTWSTPRNVTIKEFKPSLQCVVKYYPVILSNPKCINIFRLLGFENMNSIEKEFDYEEDVYEVCGTYEVNLASESKFLNIFTNITSSVQFADKEINLLRSIPLNENRLTSTSTKVFSNPFHVPLSVTQIDSINIKCRNEYDKELKFLPGDIQITLHFLAI